MGCEVEQCADGVRIRGEMSIYGAAALKQSLFALLNETQGGCRIDLSDVSELDTTAIQLLIMAQRACVARGGSLSIANPSAAVREALDLLRLHSLNFVTA